VEKWSFEHRPQTVTDAWGALADQRHLLLVEVNAGVIGTFLKASLTLRPYCGEAMGQSPFGLAFSGAAETTLTRDQANCGRLELDSETQELCCLLAR
jgi:hypothetical protein